MSTQRLQFSNLWFAEVSRKQGFRGGGGGGGSLYKINQQSAKKAPKVTFLCSTSAGAYWCTINIIACFFFFLGGGGCNWNQRCIKERHANKFNRDLGTMQLLYIHDMAAGHGHCSHTEASSRSKGGLQTTRLFLGGGLCPSSLLWLTSELSSLRGQRHAPRVAPSPCVSLHPQSGVSCLTLVITLPLPLHTVTNM